MKAKGAIITLGWGDTYFFDSIATAQEVIGLLAIGSRVEKEYSGSKNYLVEKVNAEVKMELVYTTPIEKEEMQAIREEHAAKEAAKKAAEEAAQADTEASED